MKVSSQTICFILLLTTYVLTKDLDINFDYEHNGNKVINHNNNNLLSSTEATSPFEGSNRILGKVTPIYILTTSVEKACSNPTDCNNKGTCSQNLCFCDEGSYGTNCETAATLILSTLVSQYVPNDHKSKYFYYPIRSNNSPLTPLIDLLKTQRRLWTSSL